MINLKGKNSLHNITEEDLIKLGIKSVSVISEASFKPRIIIAYLNNEESLIDVEKNKNVTDRINEELDIIVKKYIIKQRKEKLQQLKTR